MVFSEFEVGDSGQTYIFVATDMFIERLFILRSVSRIESLRPKSKDRRKQRKLPIKRAAKSERNKFINQRPTHLE